MSDTPLCDQCFEEAQDFSRSVLVIPLVIGRDLERKLNAAREALTRLVAASESFAADQAGATDDRCGLVQPITVAEGNELLAALQQAMKTLEA